MTRFLKKSRMIIQTPDCLASRIQQFCEGALNNRYILSPKANFVPSVEKILSW